MTRPSAPLDQRRLATISWGALLAGLVAFLGVAGFVQGRLQTVDAQAARVLLMAAVALSLAGVVASRFVPSLLPRADQATPDQHALARNVVACALCEGPGLFSLIAWMLGGSALALVPLAVSMAGLAACFPGDARWAELGGAPPPR